MIRFAKSSQAFALALLAVPTLAACVYVDEEPTIRGSGIARTETRELSDFKRIEVSGSTDVIVTVGSATSVSVTGDDNVVEHITTEVASDTLLVSMRSGSYSPRIDPVVRVTLPELVALEVRGSCDATIEGLSGGELSAVSRGSGDVVASGRVDRLVVDGQGSGDFELAELEARDASLSLRGSGAANVHATAALRVEIRGSGDVSYRGDPAELSTEVHGSGSIRKR